MIQVDVFWSFAMGAAFASLAQEGIKKSNHIFVNKYFVYTVCYLSMVFAPSGVYLLWHHTAWETMFFYDKTMHGILPCIFATTNVLLGVIGFCLCYRLIKAGMEGYVHGIWTTAYTIMFSILTLGYNRFLYAGTEEEWKKGVSYSIPWDFFYSEVFKALLVMSIFVLPPLYYAMSSWPAEYGIDKYGKSELIRQVFTPYCRVSCLVITGYLALYVSKQVPDTWGFDRLYAFLIGQAVFGLMLFVPLFFVRVSSTQRRSRRD